MFKSIIRFMLISSIALSAFASEKIPTQEEVGKLYVATFNRAPDAKGLDWWVNTSGFKLSQIAQSFFDQDETKELYPEGTSTTAFITSVYTNLFNRDPDDEGLTYWKKELDTGIFTKNRFIEAVINGAQDSETSQDATILKNKNSVGIYFAQTGLKDTTEAKNIMKDITADSTSVNTAFTQIVNNTNITINKIVNNYNNDTCSKDYETIRDGMCVLKTCEADGFNCPVCDSGDELKYYNNGYGFCKGTDKNETLPVTSLSTPPSISVNTGLSTPPSPPIF